MKKKIKSIALIPVGSDGKVAIAGKGPYHTDVDCPECGNACEVKSPGKKLKIVCTFCDAWVWAQVATKKNSVVVHC